jgi:hypothetical protein
MIDTPWGRFKKKDSQLQKKIRGSVLTAKNMEMLLTSMMINEPLLQETWKPGSKEDMKIHFNETVKYIESTLIIHHSWFCLIFEEYPHLKTPILECMKELESKPWVGSSQTFEERIKLNRNEVCIEEFKKLIANKKV